ncbi:hypothetical protein JWJ90_17790 [Desulfobulbus rhabdoformis]|uniref:hypothetical protein n=1 Tax=Desulfobulbus rhabdoformis TaxID=34032 RepID=UPI0019631A16|nr:hypothetical protein [Desulfobulbus rhabdoformis]MBM9616124.1 hypothetical protein [Desulfobulbus rhabdoformis]
MGTVEGGVQNRKKGGKTMISRKMSAGVAAGCLLLSASLANTGWSATSGSHYNYGVEGVLGATAPPPGWHYRMYNLWYNPDTLNDNNGKKIHNGFDLVPCNNHKFG